MRAIRRIVVHSSATPPHMDIGAEEIRKWHTDPQPKGRGWNDIGYHKVIRRSGKIEQGREYGVVPACVRGFNSDSICICIVGGADEHGNADANFTFAQYHALLGLLAQLKMKWDVPVMGHRDLASTKCPSFDVKELVK